MTSAVVAGWLLVFVLVCVCGAVWVGIVQLSFPVARYVTVTTKWYAKRT